MRKLRSDSPWAKLTAEQRATLGFWLREENLSYREVLERAQKEFGVKACSSSLVRFYQQLADEQLHEELSALQATTDKVENRSLEWEELTRTAMTLVANRLIQLAIARPERIRDLATLARIMVASETAQVKRRWLEMEEDKRELAEREQFRRKAWHEALRIHRESAAANQPAASPDENKAGSETPPETPGSAYSAA